MKKIFITLLAVVVTYSFSFAQLKTPAPSPAQTIKQDFGLSDIELSYSRPGKKDRKVIGDLVPFGAIWRTGANQATTLTFGDDVIIGGKTVPAGKYGLLTIPGKDNWTFIITKQTNVTSPDAYKMENDVARVSAKPMKMTNMIETFTIVFANVKASSCDLQVMWENTVVTLPIKTDVDKKVMSQITEAMKADKPPYFAAASYYFDNGKDMKQAKDWATKAVDGDPKAFYMVHLLAKIQAKLGDKTGAVTTAKKSIELAKEAKNNDYVKLNEKLIAGLK